MVVALCALGACVDPFEQETTTPTKYRGQTAAASQSGTQSGQTTNAAKGDATQKGDKQKDKKGKKNKKKPEQTYKQAWHMICHADTLAKPDPGLTPQQRNDVIVDWLVTNLKNEKARFWFIEFGKKKNKDRRKLLLTEATAAGVSPCPFSESLFAVPPGPAPPKSPAGSGVIAPLPEPPGQPSGATP